MNRYEWGLTGLVVLGVALRVVMIHRWPVVYDGATMATMGWSLLRNGEFLVPYAEGVEYYRHYPPLYPAYLALWYAGFGFSAGVTQAASFALTLLSWSSGSDSAGMWAGIQQSWCYRLANSTLRFS